jgi:peptidoglycan/xylan/chitin deacetylase (PgdA/CDA1 family)
MPDKPVAVFEPQGARIATRRVWLTFDDGPHPHHTKTILDALKDKGISATFFVLGTSVKRVGKALLQRIRKEGHRIGNHSCSHVDLRKLSVKEVRKEIMSAETLIADLLGSEKLFRPPYGASNATVDQAIKELGYLKILWNVDTLDWSPAYQPDLWVQYGILQIRQRVSSVVLAHDVHKSTADHIADFIQRIERIGFVNIESCWTL